MLTERLSLLFHEEDAPKMHQTKQKGVVFAVHNKHDFTASGAKGHILHSFDTLCANAPSYSHFTPNVYRVGAFHAATSTISGFTEKNLHHINAFVVDIDTKEFTPQQLLLTCIDESVGAPTWIIETTRGYQLYFVLATPLYMAKDNHAYTLRIAKRIAYNLKRSLHNVKADLYCNDFGFFRMPLNVVWEQHSFTYTVAQLIDWSSRFDDNAHLCLKTPTTHRKQLYIHAPWYKALLQATHIKGDKGQLGRNNTLFTLALAGFHDGFTQEATQNVLQSFNARLHAPLSHKELTTILQSAYSGRYTGPSKAYVEELIALYAPEQHVHMHTHWYKHKKERTERTRSHFNEWEQDITTYITAQKDPSAPFLWHTQKQMCQALNIPQSTLNALLKTSSQLITTTIGKGRGAQTGWTTVTLYKQFLFEQALQKATKKGQYYTQLHYVLHYYAPLTQNKGYQTLYKELTQPYYYSNVP